VFGVLSRINDARRDSRIRREGDAKQKAQIAAVAKTSDIKISPELLTFGKLTALFGRPEARESTVINRASTPEEFARIPPGQPANIPAEECGWACIDGLMHCAVSATFRARGSEIGDEQSAVDFTVFSEMFPTTRPSARRIHETPVAHFRGSIDGIRLNDSFDQVLGKLRQRGYEVSQVRSDSAMVKWGDFASLHIDSKNRQVVRMSVLSDRRFH
jgi:hypothetical protein